MNKLNSQKILRLVGPYPYNPYLLFLFCFSIFFFRFFRAVAFLPQGQIRIRAAAIVFLVSAVPGLFYAGLSILLTRYRLWSSKSTILYVLEVAAVQLFMVQYLHVSMNFLEEEIGYSDVILVAESSRYFFVGLLVFLFALALMHQAERKISERLSLATNLVSKLEHERIALIHSVEELRKQTSQFLHDRVQSDLMVVGMKLRSISGQSSTKVNDVIERAISRLENTRAADLKNLIQVLTPNLDAGTLSSAIDVLLERYRQTMQIMVHVDESSEGLDSEAKLGIYRIIEQAILNSLVHGPATNVQIEVVTKLSSITTVVISDNGPGAIFDEALPGVGSAIIDSWVGILSGSSNIETSPGHGYRLEVSFPQ